MSADEMLEKLGYKKKNLDIENNLSLFNMKVPFIAPDLIALRDKYKSECFAHFGINYNPSEGKKERLLKDEINSNNDYINSMCDLMFKERQKAIEKVNKKYGLNIIVEKNYGTDEIEMKEGDDING